VDTTARVWREVESGIWTATVLEGHQSEVNSAAFSPDGRFVFTVSSDLTTRVWHENIDGSWASRPLVGAEENILAIAFSPDGQRVLTTSIFDSLWVWSARNDMTWMGTPIVSRRSQVSERSTTREFRPAVFSPDGLQVAQATEEGTARVLDVRYLAGPEDWVTSEPRPRAAAICEERMSNSLFEDRHPDRLITQGDAEAYPALQGRVGEDVCAPLVNPPPWWRALTFWE
jgi:WD40 repeat protein